MSRTAPLLIFDSGVGGLSVLDAIRAALPNAPLVYAADSAAFPYGERSEAELTARVPALLRALVAAVQPRLVVIACNTASTTALQATRAVLDVPVVGVVPAIKPAAEQSRSRVIAILGTPVTVRQPYVDALVAAHAADCRVLRVGSTALVRLAEAQLRGEGPPDADFAAAIALLLGPEAADLDTVVLACTHFPLVQDILARVMRTAQPERPVTFVDSGAGIARRVAFLTQGQRWPDVPGWGRTLFTRLDAHGPALVSALAQRGLAPAEWFNFPWRNAQ